MKLRLLFILIFIASAPSYGATQDAVKEAARALYFQQNWDDHVNNFVKYYERKLTPEQKRIGGQIYWLAKVAIDKEIRFTWSW
jgi:hypothetical protein